MAGAAAAYSRFSTHVIASTRHGCILLIAGDFLILILGSGGFLHITFIRNLAYPFVLNGLATPCISLHTERVAKNLHDVFALSIFTKVFLNKTSLVV